MDSIKLLLCRYGSEVVVVRLFGGIKLYDVFKKICDRWQNLCYSLSYVLDGSDCKIVDEEAFDNMIYLCPASNRIYAIVEEFRSSIALSGGSSSGVTFGSSSGCLENVDDEEPLDDFCRHTDTRYLTSSWVNLIHSVGQVFRGGVDDFRGVLQRYAIENGFMYEFVKNDKFRVTAVCKIAKCEWRVHAILNRVTGEFRIKELVNDHRCGSTYRRNKHKRVPSSLVANEITNTVQQNNNTSPMYISEFFMDKYGLDLSYHHAWL
ncbi:hypothetical protein Vadar_032720 [Vaccinium darrowii]|uniref:Uncharacterized protein n=1 Tax=Vaccinium darrowii TaxID=229202 RepID=A0ACB7ZFZ5_9ERIC|nr:hypothetical protein Vadar_032720 [Vaccinium darrowii]